MKRLTLALDVMGGDFGPRTTIPAVLHALNHHATLNMLLFGNEAEILPYLKHISPEQQSRLDIVHTEKVIDDNLPFLQALRNSQKTSMRLAIEAVADGRADGCVSGGNTGILMGLAKQLIVPIAEIERPALTSLIPTMNGKSGVMLDLGANVEADSHLLCQFAEMGNVFAEAMLGLVYPRIALLNIGTEEQKGTAEIKAAHQQLKQRHHLNYQGFIEGDKLMNNLADVIVCDGFSGNIALKTLEGMAKNVLTLFRQSNDHSNLCRMARYTLLRLLLFRHYRKLQEINPDRHNGATLLGLSKVVVKSHGGAGVSAYAYAIEFALNQVKQEIPQRLKAQWQQAVI